MARPRNRRCPSPHGGTVDVAFRRGARLALAALLVASRAFAAGGEVPEHADDPSAFVTIIEATDYDDRFETVADLLDHVAGVRVRRYGGLGAYSTASVRGAKSERVLLLLDGVRLNSAYRGDVDLSTLPLRLVERIEVVRGSGGARYGSDAVGGVISITSRAPEPDTGWDVAGTSGDLGTLGGNGLVSGARGRLSSLVAYDRLRSDNDFRFRLAPPRGSILPVAAQRRTRLGAGFLRQTGLATADWRIDGDRRLAASLRLEDADRGEPGSTLRGRATDPGDGCTTASERERRGIVRLGLSDRALGPGSLEAALYHRFERLELDDPGGHCDLVDPIARDGRDDVDATERESGFDLRYAARPLRLGPVLLRGRSATGLRLQGWRGSEGDDTGRWVGTFFVQEDVGLFGGWLRLIPALGLELAHTRETRVRDPATREPVGVSPDDDAAWLPRLGAIASLGPGLRLKANVERSFRRPTFGELFLPDRGFVRGNPRLRAEESLDLDVGFEGRRSRLGPLRDLRAELVGFRRDLDDPIEFVQVDGFTFAPQNLPRSEVRGIEIQGGFSFGDRLDVAAAYTRTRATTRDGADLPHRPRNRLHGSVSFRLAAARLWGEILVEDEFPLTTGDGALTAPDTSQIDLGVTLPLSALPFLRRLPGDPAVSLEWANVTDEDRVDSLGLPLPGRTFRMTLRAARR